MSFYRHPFRLSVDNSRMEEILDEVPPELESQNVPTFSRLSALNRFDIRLNAQSATLHSDRKPLG